MKKTIAFMCLVFVGGICFAQQLPHFTQYFLNPYVINPAATGVAGAWVGQINGRYQWVGIKDAPRTFNLSLNGPLNNKKIGLGAQLFTDIVGPTRRTGISGSYAYQLKLTDDINLGMGMSLGLLDYVIDGSKVSLENPDDIAISNGLQRSLEPDAGIGFHLYSDEFYVGVSAPQIIGKKVKFFDDYNGDASLDRHYFFYGGYKYKVNEEIMIEPAALVKMVPPAPVQFEASVRGVYKNMVWAGAAYRMDAAVMFMLGYTFQDNLSFGYSYDMPTSKIGTHTSGTHELLLSIKFRKRMAYDKE